MKNIKYTIFLIIMLFSTMAYSRVPVKFADIVMSNHVAKYNNALSSIKNSPGVLIIGVGSDYVQVKATLPNGDVKNIMFTHMDTTNNVYPEGSYLDVGNKGLKLGFAGIDMLKTVGGDYMQFYIFQSLTDVQYHNDLLITD
tara:strand:- start:2861 stop:3283 length:423 start_codon:yes stop_codon:yes gene_type:complete